MNPWIAWQGDEDEAGGAAEALRQARKRAGKVFHIVRIMSPNPAVLDASMHMYAKLMQGSSPLSRAQREMLAAAVSRLNQCRY